MQKTLLRLQIHWQKQSSQNLVSFSSYVYPDLGMYTLLLRLFVPFFKTSGRGDVKKITIYKKNEYLLILTKKIKNSSSFFSSRMKLKIFFYILCRKVSNLLFSLCLQVVCSISFFPVFTIYVFQYLLLLPSSSILLWIQTALQTQTGNKSSRNLCI